MADLEKLSKDDLISLLAVYSKGLNSLISQQKNAEIAFGLTLAKSYFDGAIKGALEKK